MEEKLSLKSLDKKMDDKLDGIVNSIANIATVVEELVNRDKKIGQVVGKAPEKEPVKIVDEAGPKELQALPVELQSIVDIYFDESDGFKAEFDTMKSMFSITVPLERSNMSEASKLHEKKDVRSKKVDQNDIKGSVDNWCKLVCQNLKYNRAFKLK